jgi:hypothetical protein
MTKGEAAVVRELSEEILCRLLCCGWAALGRKHFRSSFLLPFKPRFSATATVMFFLLVPPIAAASACIGQDAEYTIFFDEEDGTKGFDVPVVLDVTIRAISQTADQRPIAIAQVNRKIRGQIEGDEVKIRVFPSSCARGLAAGARGVVIGKMTVDARGNPELDAVSETFGEREHRRANSSGQVFNR